MKKQKGFTLIELLIVIVIIGIIAAIAIPGLLRARANANEAGAIGDTRSVISAAATYAASNGQAYDQQVTCYASPAGGACIPGYTSTILTFLDPKIASDNNVQKSGYNRAYLGGPLAADLTADMSATSTNEYTYAASAVSSRTGQRAFCGDSSGLICFDMSGDPAVVCTQGTGLLAGCPVIQ